MPRKLFAVYNTRTGKCLNVISSDSPPPPLSAEIRCIEVNSPPGDDEEFSETEGKFVKAVKEPKRSPAETDDSVRKAEIRNRMPDIGQQLDEILRTIDLNRNVLTLTPGMESILNQWKGAKLGTSPCLPHPENILSHLVPLGTDEVGKNKNDNLPPVVGLVDIVTGKATVR